MSAPFRLPFSGEYTPLTHRPSSPGAAVHRNARKAVIYLLVAAIWIFMSDRMLLAFAPSSSDVAALGTMKGWLFAVATAGGFFWLLHAQCQRQREGELRLRSFVEQSPVALAVLDRDLRYVTTSRRWRTDFKLGDGDLAGRRHYDVFPHLPQSWRDVHQRALRGETFSDELSSLVRQDGAVVWMRREVQPWRDASGEIGGIVIFVEDVTARKLSEDALRESQARLRLALRAGRVSTWVWDLAHGRVDHDEGVAALFGRTREDILSGGIEYFLNCIHPDDRPAVQAVLARAAEGDSEAAADYRVVRPDGSTVWIADRWSIERDETGTAVRMTGACVDITNIKRIQEALQLSEVRFREVVETIREVFWVSDVSKERMLYVSPGYEQIWGRRCEELYASSRTWLEAIHEDDRERVAHALPKQAEGTYDETYRVVRPDGRIRWVRDLAYPVRDEDGTLLRIVGCARDITERKDLEEQFLRAQRLEAIGTLASGVAHDLNNILAPMFMIGPLLRENASGADRDMLAIMEKSAQRGANVVRQLLTFSRGVAGERGPVQVRHLVKEMTAIMDETFPREIGIVHQVPSDLWPVMADATQLHQVLMNLCVNARDAMPAGGRLSIDAKNAEIGPAEVAGQIGVEPGPYVVITVADTGHGIPEEHRAKIFEPFFTTKAAGKGTGLGLSTVMGIVKSHGGFVTLESEVGRGTKFHVHLPSWAEADAVAGPLAPAEAAPGHGELILIVDDEVNVRQAMHRVLEHNGYAVLTAANGREGLGLYLLQRDKVKVVVTDLMMPEMSGVGLVRALRDVNPTLQILAATGLISGAETEELSTAGVSEVLPKPYTSFELIDAVGRAIARAAQTTE